MRTQKPDTAAIRRSMEYWAKTNPQFLGTNLYAQMQSTLDWIDSLGDLGDGPFPGKTKTSKAAAQKIAPKVGTIQHKVLEQFKRMAGAGATDSELFAFFTEDQNTIRARRCELRDMGFIRDSGCVRPNHKKNDETVWVIT